MVAPRASSDVLDNHHMSLRRFTGMKRLCAIVDFIFSPLRPAFGLGSPKQFRLLIVCFWSRSDSMEGSYSMQNKTGKENNVQVLGAGGVLRELHCSTFSQSRGDPGQSSPGWSRVVRSSPGTERASGDEM